MFKVKAHDGKNNLCGKNVRALRKEIGLSQRGLASRLQLSGIDMDHYAIRRIENGERFVTDIELLALSAVLRVDINELLRQCLSSEYH